MKLKVKKMSPEKNSNIFYALSIAWQLGFLIAIPIAGFIFLGLLGDGYFKTKPLFLIIGIIVGMLITLYEVYHILSPLMKEKKHA